MLASSYIYLENVGDNCKVMFILLLVELLKVGGVIAFAVSSHLVPHLSLLPCLRKKKPKKKTNSKHVYQRHAPNLNVPD